MKVVIAVASRHGSTRDIGDRIGARLFDAGLDVHLADVDSITSLDDADAVVLGSAVYMGRWEPSARLFVDEYVDELDSVPAWVFSSGPVGPTGVAPAGIRDHEVAVLALGPVDSRVFGGDLDYRALSMQERFVCKLLRVAEGDYRDWNDIDNWADTIADTLNSGQAGTARGRQS